MPKADNAGNTVPDYFSSRGGVSLLRPFEQCGSHLHTSGLCYAVHAPKWKWHSTDDEDQASGDENGVWVEAAESDLSLTEEEAKLIAAVAAELDCQKLEDLWRQLGILRDETFCLDEWRWYRASFVAVL